MKYKIAISGSYGGMNLGDEAILEGILQSLKARLNIDVVVLSFNAKDTSSRHKVRAIPFRDMHKEEIIEELKKLDLFIVGGGGVLFDGLAEILLGPLIWAKELGVPSMIYAVSAGPLNNQASKEFVRDALAKADVITVREDESKRLLNDIGVTKDIIVTADPALLLQPSHFTKEMLKKEGIDPEKTLVGFSVREPGLAAPGLDVELYHTILANCADFMVERFDAHIIFVPMEYGANKDSQHAHAIISKMTDTKKAIVLREEYTSPLVLDLMRHMTFAVGMRLHFLIFAGIQNVPFIPLAYASKVRGFLEDLDVPFLSKEEWNSGKICAMIDRAFDNRKNIQKNLQKKVPLLQEKAKVTNKILFEFLKTITPKK